MKLILAHPLAIWAGAIPLGKSSAGGRAEDLYPHAADLQLRVGVGIDFAAEIDFFKCGGCPLHGSVLQDRQE